MIIGILSDSHGRALRTRDAIALLCDTGAEVLIHLGDVETEAVLDELAGHPARLVFGNCDWDVSSLTDYATCLGIRVDHPLGVLEHEDIRIAFTHGDRASLLAGAIEDGVDYLLHGHSHQVHDELVGQTRVINPGALHRAARYTVASLDLDGGVLSFHELPRRR